MVRREQAGELAAALRRLPPRHGRALLLHHGFGLPVGDVAAVVGGNANSTGQLLHRARRGMRRELAAAA